MVVFPHPQFVATFTPDTQVLHDLHMVIPTTHTHTHMNHHSYTFFVLWFPPAQFSRSLSTQWLDPLYTHGYSSTRFWLPHTVFVRAMWTFPTISVCPWVDGSFVLLRGLISPRPVRSPRFAYHTFGYHSSLPHHSGRSLLIYTFLFIRWTTPHIFCCSPLWILIFLVVMVTYITIILHRSLCMCHAHHMALLLVVVVYTHTTPLRDITTPRSLPPAHVYTFATITTRSHT